MGLRNRHLYKEFNCFFVTTSCVNWIPVIELSNSYNLLEKSLAFVCDKFDANILAYVLMPNHIHLIVYFKKENRLSDFMRDFKKFTSVRMRQAIELHDYGNLLENLRSSKSGRTFQIWQDHFDSNYLESKWFLEQKLDYIHANPLQEKWKLVKDPVEYKYSSAGFYYLDKKPRLAVTHYAEYFC